MMWNLVLLALFIYISLVLWFIKGWLGLKVRNDSNDSGSLKIAVIIPCRNETENINKILGAIDNQHFDFKNLEIFVIDDHSTDDTFEKATNFRGNNFKPIVLKLNNEEFGKKTAINKAINSSNSEIIVCTDADCLAENKWLTTLTEAFLSPQIQMVSGPVMFFEQKGFWNQLMQLEFISLIGIGGASVQNGMPNMCNGANIAYRKSAFIAVNGFEGNEHIPSGDDEFLMHKILTQFNVGIEFIKNHEAMVYTQGPQSFNEFVNQRIRWGGKAGHYKSIKSKLLPAFMFLFNALLFFTPVLFFMGMPWTLIATLWIGKLGVEILFFSTVLPFFRSSKILDLVIPAQIFHVIYITLIGLLTIGKTYTWKGRKIK